MRLTAILLAVTVLAFGAGEGRVEPTTHEMENEAVVLRATEAMKRGDLAAWASGEKERVHATGRNIQR